MENYWVDVEEKSYDVWEITITKPFWVASEIWEPGLVFTTRIPPLQEEVVIIYIQELGYTVRVPITHCDVQKFKYVKKVTTETFWVNWEDDGIIPAEEVFFGKDEESVWK